MMGFASRSQSWRGGVGLLFDVTNLSLKRIGVQLPCFFQRAKSSSSSPVWHADSDMRAPWQCQILSSSMRRVIMDASVLGALLCGMCVSDSVRSSGVTISGCNSLQRDINQIVIHCYRSCPVTDYEKDTR